MKHYLSKKINRYVRLHADQCMQSDTEESMPRKHDEHLARLFLVAFNDVLCDDLGADNPLEHMGGENPGQPEGGVWDPAHRFPKLTDDLCRVRVCEGILYSYKNGYWRGHHEKQLRGYLSGFDGMEVWGGPTTTDAKGKKREWYLKTKRLGLTQAVKRGVVECLLEIEEIQDPGFFDTSTLDVGGVCLKNGFLMIDRYDLVSPEGKTKEWRIGLVPHSPSHKAKYRMDFDWPDEQPERPAAFIGHLERCYRDDADKEQKIAVIQEFIGMAVTGFAHRISSAKCLLLEGQASSGKSIIHECIERLFPRRDSADNMLVLSQAPSEWTSAAGSNAGDFKKAAMVHCVLNSKRELPKWSRLVAAEDFKQFITGDPISFRRPGGEGATFFPKAAHIFSNNNTGQKAPEINEGFFRRFLIILHNRSFKPGDGEARDKISYMAELTSQESLTQLFSWGVIGAMRVLRNGERYTDCESSEGALDRWRDAANPVGAFVQECCLEGEGKSQKWKFIYEELKEYLKLKCMDRIGAMEAEELFKARGFEICTEYVGDKNRNRQKMIKGLDIKNSGNSYPWRKEIAK